MLASSGGVTADIQGMSCTRRRARGCEWVCGQSDDSGGVGLMTHSAIILMTPRPYKTLLERRSPTLARVYVTQ